jgi:hypothetical protein
MTSQVIQRSFTPYTDEANPEENKFSYVVVDHTTWDDILAHPLVAIIGEAGIGKTYELQKRAKILREQGGEAFCLSLRLLQHHDGFEFALAEGNDSDPNAASRFEAWNPQEKEAWFFLDSVDEVKLDGPDRYVAALHRFGKNLQEKQAHGKVRIILSCRPKDWHFHDAKKAENYLQRFIVQPTQNNEIPSKKCENLFDNDTDSALTSEKNSEREENIEIIYLKAYSILPFSESEIRAYAISVGNITPKEADIFINALKSSGLIPLAGRPYDVNGMMAYWKRHKKFDVYSEMLLEGVCEQLKEKNECHKQHVSASMSLDEMLEAAEELAAATVLLKNTSIRIPQQGNVIQKGLDAEHVLRKLNHHKIELLLGRRLFDEESPITIRFNQRITREYLAARWVIRLLNNDCPYKDIRHWFIGEKYGKKNLIPSRAEVAAWVAARSTELLEEMLEIAPEWLIAGGDASKLNNAQQEQALWAYAKTYANNTHFENRPDGSSLARIRGHEIEKTLEQIFTQYHSSERICSMILDIISTSNIRNLSEIFFNASIDNMFHENVRISAIRAIGNKGSLQQKQKISEYASATEISNRYLGWLGEALFPNFYDVRDMIQLLQRFKAIDRLGSGYDFMVSHDWIKACPVSQLTDFLDGLVSLLREPPLHQSDRWLADQELSLFSQKYSWLFDAAINCAIRVIKSQPHILSESLEQLLKWIWASNRTRIDVTNSQKEKIIKAIEDSLNIKRLWQRRELQEIWKIYSENGWGNAVSCRELYPLFPLRLSDVDWLKQAILTTTQENDRIAFAWGIFLIAWKSGGESNLLADLKGYLSTLDLPQPIQEDFQRRLSPREKSHSERRNEQRECINKTKEDRDIEKSKFNLLNRLSEIRSGVANNAIYYLYYFMTEQQGGSTGRWAQTNIHTIRNAFGDDITEAFMEGLQTLWYTFTPTPPSQKIEYNRTEMGTIYGLTALALMEKRGQDFSAFTPEQAAHATLFALNELNGFPSWFETLLENFPRAIQPILEYEIQHLVVSDGADPGVLYRFRNNARVINLIYPFLLSQLEMSEPPRAYLQDLLSLLKELPQSSYQERLSKLAAERVINGWRRDTLAIIPWLGLWLEYDSINAWDYIEKNVSQATVNPSHLTQEILFTIGDALDERSQDKRGCKFFNNIQLLSKVIPFIYTHIPFNEDTVYESGKVYSPSSRDRAADIRQAICRILIETDGEEAHQALVAWSQHPAAADIPAREKWVQDHAKRAIEPQPLPLETFMVYRRKYDRQANMTVNHFNLNHHGTGDIFTGNKTVNNHNNSCEPEQIISIINALLIRHSIPDDFDARPKAEQLRLLAPVIEEAEGNPSLLQRLKGAASDKLGEGLGAGAAKLLLSLLPV